MFAILVLMALFTTFMTTPTVLAIYKSSRRITSQPHRRSQGQQSPLRENPQEELRILACIHGPSNAPALINLIESTRAGRKSPLKLYAMHLVELTDRSSSIMMVQRARKNGFPFINHFSRGTSNDRVAAAFEAYGHIAGVTINHSTAISALSTMHEDICHVAEDKRVAMIILPFHKQWRGDGEDTVENLGHGWREVNQRVLKTAPCSVAVLVDRGFGSLYQEAGHAATTSKRVCILFIGGADDREALEFGGRIAEHPAISVSVTRFLIKTETSMNPESAEGLDEAAVEEFIKKWHGSVEYVEKEVSNITEEVLSIGKSREFELLVVGKGATIAKAGDYPAEHPELGVIGDILASSEYGIIPSVLVLEQHDSATTDETTMSRKVEEDISSV